MKTISATELKAKISAVLGDVERRETIGITRHGKTIARITSEHGTTRELERDRARRAVEEMRRLRAALPKTGITLEEILEWRHEGHK